MTVTRSFDFLIQWHLTERCNLRCRHCYQSGRPLEELSLAEIRETAAEAGGMLREWERLYGLSFSPSCNITGGEPLLRKDFFSVLEAVGGEGFDLYLLTNGTLLDSETARRLASCKVKGVQVSLEGPPDVHEQIRGAGSFEAALTGVRSLLAAGLSVTLNMTLTRRNARRLEEMTALAADLGVSRLGFARLVPAGRGKDLAGEMLSPAELRELYRDLLGRSVPDLNIVTGDPIAAQLGEPPPSRDLCTALGGCAAGVSGLTLLPDGTILPCRRLEIPLGNVRRDSLREVWATSDVLAALRDKERYGGKCAVCNRWAVCRGCRAVAFACSGDYLAADPQCFLAGG